MLNLSKNYGAVRGHEFVKYYQDGKHFNVAQEEVDPDTGKVLKKTPVEPKTEELVAPGFDKILASVGEDQDEVESDDLETLSWHKIKKRVEAAGGIWVDKATGIRYLRGLEE